MKLVYVSACQAGQKFVPALYYTGLAKSAVGFTKDVRFNSGSDGIHEFNMLVFKNLCNGYTVTASVQRAYNTMGTIIANACGASSYVVFGGGLFIT